VTLREAFGILALSEKDLDPRALEGLLTAKLETAEFHDIPRLLEAYRTVNGLLESQLWYWNPETTSIHHQDGSTIELRGVSAGVMTATPPSSVTQSPPQNVYDTEVELVTDSVPPPVSPSPTMAAAAVLDDAPIIIDDEAETLAAVPNPKKTLVPLSANEPFEESVGTIPPTKTAKTVSLEPQSPASAKRPPERSTTPTRPNRAAPAASVGAGEIDETHSTMVFVPPRRNSTAPWVVAAAAVGLVGALWVFQSQIGRNRAVVAPVNTTRTQAGPNPTAPKAATPAVSSPAKPVQKPSVTSPAPPAAVSSKPAQPAPPANSRPTTTAVTNPARPASASAKPIKPVAKPPTKPAAPNIATPVKTTLVRPRASAKPISAVIAPKPVVSSKPAPKNATVAKPRPVVKPPAPKPIVQAATKPNTVAAPNIPARPKPAIKPLPKPGTAATPVRPAQPTIRPKPITPRPKPVSVPAPVAVIEAPKTTGLPDNLTRDEYGRRYFNQKIFEVWQRSGAQLRYASWEAIPLELQTLPSDRFRAAVYIAAPPEPIEPPK
jgi:hypothetical protein